MVTSLSAATQPPIFLLFFTVCDDALHRASTTLDYCHGKNAY